MYYVKPCPECATRLRFPINEGSIQVRCPNCSHSFIVDPDDQSTYDDRGGFEKTSQKPPRGQAGHTFGNWWANIMVPKLQRLFNPILKHIPRNRSHASGDFSNLRFTLIVAGAIFATMFLGRVLCQPSSPPQTPMGSSPLPEEYPFEKKGNAPENFEQNEQNPDSNSSENNIDSSSKEKPFPKKKATSKKAFEDKFPEGENFFHEGAPSLGEGK